MSGPRRTVVLARRAAAAAAGVAVADGVRAGARAAVAVVVLPGEGVVGTGVRLPASAPARRLAGALTSRDIAARASGRLVLAAAGPDPTTPVTLARIEAAAGAWPVVVVCADPRTAEDEVVLREADAVVAVLPPGADPALRALLARHGPSATDALVADVHGLTRAVPVLAPLTLRAVRAAGAALGAGR